MSSSASYTLPPFATPTGTAALAKSVPVADIVLFHIADGGEIDFVNGQPRMSAGLETSVYLSLFGGNERDSGLQGDDRCQWWSNLSETEPAKKYRSRTQNLLRSVPAITSNVRRVEDAATADLAWMVESGTAESVKAVASMPGLNQVNLGVEIVVNGKTYPMSFDHAWSGI